MIKPHIEYETAVELAPEHFANIHQVLLWVRDVLIRDTPFRYQDVYEVLSELSSLDVEGRFKYNQNTTRKVLSWFKRQGRLVVLDDFHSRPSEYVYMWYSYYHRHASRGQVSGGEVA